MTEKQKWDVSEYVFLYLADYETITKGKTLICMTGFNSNTFFKNVDDLYYHATDYLLKYKVKDRKELNEFINEIIKECSND